MGRLPTPPLQLPGKQLWRSKIFKLLIMLNHDKDMDICLLPVPRKCKLTSNGSSFSNATLDIMFIDLQRRWEHANSGGGTGQ